MNTLAAHGEDLFGSKGVKASIRAELRLDLKLDKDAWKALSGHEQEDWVSHLVITGSQQRRLSNPRLSHGMQVLTATGIVEKSTIGSSFQQSTSKAAHATLRANITTSPRSQH